MLQVEDVLQQFEDFHSHRRVNTVEVVDVEGEAFLRWVMLEGVGYQRLYFVLELADVALRRLLALEEFSYRATIKPCCRDGHLCTHLGHLLEQLAYFLLAVVPPLVARVEGTYLVDDAVEDAHDSLVGRLHQRVLPSVDPYRIERSALIVAEIPPQQVHQRRLATTPLALQGDGDRCICMLDKIYQRILIYIDAEKVVLVVLTRYVDNA